MLQPLFRLSRTCDSQFPPVCRYVTVFRDFRLHSLRPGKHGPSAEVD